MHIHDNRAHRIALQAQLGDHIAVGARGDRFERIERRRPAELHMLALAQNDGHAMRQSKRKRMLKVPRDTGRIHFAE